jgi:hypothetical protein
VVKELRQHMLGIDQHELVERGSVGNDHHEPSSRRKSHAGSVPAPGLAAMAHCWHAGGGRTFVASF